jgi:hypothetical protein
MAKELIELGFETYEGCQTGNKHTSYLNFGIGKRIMVSFDNDGIQVYLKDEYYDGESNILLDRINNIDNLKLLVNLLC